MAFVKLDCKILDSTLWLDKPACDLFVTALLMAVPLEVKDSMQQIEVRSLKLTGWIVPPGWYGFVGAAGVGIINRAIFPDKQVGLDALERLGSPEDESRSKKFDGRRLVRVDGGYIVLNFQEYREKDHTSAERSRRYRDNHRHGVAPRASGVTPRSATQAEAEAEEDQSMGEVSPIPPQRISKKQIYESSEPKKKCSDDDPPALIFENGNGISRCPHRQIIDLYHEILPMCPQVRLWTPARQQYLTQRWREDRDRQDLEWWKGYFEHVAESRFLTGKCASNGKPPFRATLEWLVRPQNFAKVYEGQYDG